MKSRYVVFSHGQESGPWGSKITALAAVAAGEGYGTHSVDYQGIADPNARVAKLVAEGQPWAGELLLCGSSMGGYVSVAAAGALRPRGLFLLAPAFTMPGVPSVSSTPPAGPATLVHGLRDDVVPFADSVAYAERFGQTLHLLNSDHRLIDQLPFICQLFQCFLRSWVPAASGS